MIYSKHTSNAEVVPFEGNINKLVIDKNINTVQGKENSLMMQLESWLSKNSLLINSDKSKAAVLQLKKIVYHN
jgi:hypothetical protein